MGQNVVMAEGSNSDTFGKLITLNSSAAMLWEELKGRDFEIDDAAKLLMERYGLEREEATADAAHFAALLSEKGLAE